MEPPVKRSRGRPRKRPREQDEIVTVHPKKTVPTALVGKYVLKEFRGSNVLLGKVVNYESGLYRVTYEGGVCERLDSTKIRKIILDVSYFDDDLIRRKSELEELVLPKIRDGSEKGSSELHGDLSIENEDEEEETIVKNEDEEKETIVGSSGDVRDSVSDAGTPLPPPLQLPPSSGTIGVPEAYVSHLFSVYGFLRSFSIRLFLSPFTLDDFVGALNCLVSNTLLDAIHVSLMRVLRRHLEKLSAEGSLLASKCLRCCDWSLLDTLTWPVFLIQYLVVNGYTKGPEWKGFCNEIFSGEYYSLPASRKLTVLQILCDDVLESDELRAEMNMREESVVGVDYDAEDTLPVENGPRRVHPKYAKTTACKDNETMKFVSELNAANLPGNSISHCRDTEITEDGVDDGNGDECCLCGMDGTLLCCDGCPAVYHSRCIGVMKMYIPDGAWYCPECKINMIRPTIARGTSLKGAEIFGKDLYGQIFMGTCDHLLVLDVNSGKFCLKYYNQNDIPKVLQVLTASIQHRPIYHGICVAVLQYWNIPESFLPLCITAGSHVNSSTASLLPMVEEDHKPVGLVKAECNLTLMSSVFSDNIIPSLDASSLVTQSHAPESCNTSAMGSLAVNTKLQEKTVIGSAVSTFNNRRVTSHQNSVSRSTAVDPAKCSLVSSQINDCRHSNDIGFPMNLYLQTKATKDGFRKCKGSSTNDYEYMGSSYKPQSYVNYYIHGDFAASAAANLAVLSSEDSRSVGHVTDNLRKASSENTFLLAKAFSLTASRFFWPSSEKKLVEVPRERCGWCLSCKAPVSSKKACMLNHAALSATKSVTKVLSNLAPVRNGEGSISSIATYVIYMEESLRGLIVGPFLSENYRKQWRKQLECATSFGDIKPLLLKLEENIRTIAFGGDWVKLKDDWLADFSILQTAACTPGMTQKRAPCGKRKKQLRIDEVTAVSQRENFVWWHGGKFTKSVFVKAVLPKSMVRKAARQGGLRKISSIFYAEGSEIPKRTRQLVWRAALQMSRNASQLALQVRYLDFHIRWSDLIRPEHNVQDGKGQDNIEDSVFRNANVVDKKIVEGKIFYGIAFAGQKHLPSRVMKNAEMEQGPEGNEKYWFSEVRIPLYLVKEFEEGTDNVPSDEEHLNVASQLHKRWFKATWKDKYFYLTCKRDKMDMLSCSVCQLGVLFRSALKCSACQGYCHKGCSISLTVSTDEEVEFLTSCRRCYHAKGVSKIHMQKGNRDKSPTSPLLLQGQENSSLAVPKEPKPGFNDQALTSTRTGDKRPVLKQVSDYPLETKSRRRNCSWGIIWKKKNNDETGFDFRLNNILLKGSSGLPQLEPVCHLCRKPYRSDLMYICCETCKKWYHAEAVELEESKIFDVTGFKCCRCRKIKSPVCPYSDLMSKKQDGKNSLLRASNKEHSGLDSDSGTFTDMRALEPATPIFPAEDVSGQKNDPQLFSLSSVELVTEPNFEVDIEFSTVSGSKTQKLSVRRHVKREGDNNGSCGGKVPHGKISTNNEMGNLAKSAEVLSRYGSAVLAGRNLSMEFEPHTFSKTELLQPNASNHFVEADVRGMVSLDNSGPTISSQGSAHQCSQCSKLEPAPDLSCQTCGIWIHRQCSPWLESSTRFESWRCGNCREWQ